MVSCENLAPSPLEQNDQHEIPHSKQNQDILIDNSAEYKFSNRSIMNKPSVRRYMVHCNIKPLHPWVFTLLLTGVFFSLIKQHSFPFFFFVNLSSQLFKFMLNKTTGWWYPPPSILFSVLSDTTNIQHRSMGKTSMNLNMSNKRQRLTLLPLTDL